MTLRGLGEGDGDAEKGAFCTLTGGYWRGSKKSRDLSGEADDRLKKRFFRVTDGE